MKCGNRERVASFRVTPVNLDTKTSSRCRQDMQFVQRNGSLSSSTGSCFVSITTNSVSDDLVFTLQQIGGSIVCTSKYLAPIETR